MLLHIWLFGKVRSLGLAVSLSYFCVSRTEMVHSTYIDLSSRVFCKIVHDVISHILNCTVTTKWNSTNGVDPYVVKQSHCACVTDVLEDFLCKWRTISVGIHFRIWILNDCIFFDTSLRLDQFWSKCVDSLTVVIIAF